MPQLTGSPSSQAGSKPRTAIPDSRISLALDRALRYRTTHRAIGYSAAQGEHRSSGDDESIGGFALFCDIVNLHTGSLHYCISTRANGEGDEERTNSGLGHIVSVCSGVVLRPRLMAALVFSTWTSEAMLVAGLADILGVLIGSMGVDGGTS
jgi:hypothetical protein